MKTPNKRVEGKISFPLFIIASSLILYSTTFYNYLLFHSLVELATVVISFGIFVVAWTARRYIDKNFLLILGISYFFIGCLDLLHLLSYEGMNVFTSFNPNLPTQFWVAARYLEAISFFTAALFLKVKANNNFRKTQIKSRLIFFIYFITFLLFYLAIVYWKVFPDAYIEGDGLTSFKRASEYIVVVFFIVSIVILVKKKNALSKEMNNLLILALATKVISELFFTSYIGVYDFFNMMGYIFKFISFLLLYKAVLEIGLMRPYDFIFRDLQESQKKYRQSQKKLREETRKRLIESYEHMGEINRKIPILLDINGYSDENKDKQSLPGYILSVAFNVSKAKLGLLYRYDSKKKLFILIHQKGATRKKLYDIETLGFDRSKFIRRMISTKKKIAGPFRIIRCNCLNGKNAIHYSAAFPIIKDKKIKGLLFLGFRGTDFLDTNDLIFFDLFIIHVSEALDRAGFLE